MHKLLLKDFKEEVKSMEFAWTSFSNKSAVIKFPDAFLEGEVSCHNFYESLQ